MRIYVAHSTNFDFKTELYNPIINSVIYKKYEIILPHVDDTFINSKEIIKSSDLVLAEVSFPSTGEGIELGWADVFGIRIICFNKHGLKVSAALRTVSEDFIEYDDISDMINKIINYLEK